MKKLILICAVLLANCFLLSACNTVAGMGKDMQAGGKEIQKAAN